MTTAGTTSSHDENFLVSLYLSSEEATNGKLKKSQGLKSNATAFNEDRSEVKSAENQLGLSVSIQRPFLFLSVRRESIV